MIFERGDRYQSSKLRAMLKILKKHEGQKTIVFVSHPYFNISTNLTDALLQL